MSVDVAPVCDLSRVTPVRVVRDRRGGYGIPMAMMDSVKRLMAGRSAAVERGIDKAVDYLGRSTDTLRRQAEVAKARARALDPDHPEGADTGVTPTRVTPVSDETRLILPADVTAVSPPPVPPPPAPPPPPPSTGGSALRGDLVDPPEGSPSS